LFTRQARQCFFHLHALARRQLAHQADQGRHGLAIMGFQQSERDPFPNTRVGILQEAMCRRALGDGAAAHQRFPR
jgi:hypothetical protein